MLLRCWWGGVGGGGMLTYLVLRTWSIATLLRSLGSFTTLHVATLLMGWGGGWGMLTYLVLRTWSIDAAWSAVKNFIPNSLSSKSKDLLLYAKFWQWRYVNGHSRLQQKTISTLKRLVWQRMKKGLAHFLPKTHTKRKFGQICAPKFGQIFPIKLCVSLFFLKTCVLWARFPVRRVDFAGESCFDTRFCP